ncbi:MAG TPA: class I SAM-dependent methyltransferase [Candidatus Saccharimonadales bacterium]|nr:class I SAM-dependent methyltransferase [Candidatus Saccharimonadales bacterium]
MSASKAADARADARADALARLYDIDLLEDPGDLDLYLALAARTGGPILELAVGTGRLAVPLATAGHDVTGVDLDPAMLARAATRARLEGATVEQRVHLVHGDARWIRMPAAGRFRLAFVALNSLLVMAGRADQRAVLETLAVHLAPGGLAVVDIWLPDAEDLARYDGRLGLEYVRINPETAGTVTRIASARHDAATATVELTSIYDEGQPGASTVRWIREDVLHLLGAAELRVLAREAGLRVDVLAGSYDLEPLRAGDDRAVLVATVAGPDRPDRARRSSGREEIAEETAEETAAAGKDRPRGLV